MSGPPSPLPHSPLATPLEPVTAPGVAAGAPHAVALIERARAQGNRVALVDREGEVTYRDLVQLAERAAATLLAGAADLAEARVAFLVPSGRHYVITQWGIWLAGGIAVPLCVSHPRPELEYTVTDADASILVSHPEYHGVVSALASDLGRRWVGTDRLTATSPVPLPPLAASRRAMILYTSGTTGKPKGVVTTHRTIQAQITALIEAWGWTEHDRILHVLPLHHLHGIINVLACSLWAGATCEMLPKFDPAQVWTIFGTRRLTLFMAVPSIYQRLVQFWEESEPARQAQMTASCSALRLMVCGSAALPVPVLERWRTISGHTLLERYGMTEIGMGLSNPLHGERVPGAVGAPLPGVQVRLLDESGREVADGEPGQIEVRGDAVFSEYWRRPEETRRAFNDGWFQTGDIAVRSKGIYRILGRNSVDIIKSGGYKISALEIEQTLLGHPDIAECAVVGVADMEWGERVCAAIRWRNRTEVPLADLRAWTKERLASYKVPGRICTVDDLPRNAMGKVVKKEVSKLFAPAAGSPGAEQCGSP
ncbi:MAG: acyl-CoA synthetase [Opitutaceae bacterium]|nr:acyl-CoA synthetase [Opitutaceae bacterium]